MLEGVSADGRISQTVRYCNLYVFSVLQLQILQLYNPDLQNVGLAFWAGLVDLVTILAVEVALRANYREIQFRHGCDVDIWVTLGQVVHKHSAALETQLAVITLEDKLLVIGRRDLRHKLGFTGGLRRAATSSRLRFISGRSSRRMDSPYMITELVLWQNNCVQVELGAKIQTPVNYIFYQLIMCINLSSHLRNCARLSWFSFSFIYFMRVINIVKVN